MFQNNQRGQEPLLPKFPQRQDILDQAIEEILGKENPAAYSVFTAAERIIRQFSLDMEAHGLLFEAYLCGKKALQQGKKIRNPHAWLKGTAYNIAREKSRKRKRTYSYAPDILDVILPDERDSPLDKAILEEEIATVLKAMAILQEEKPEIFSLIYQRLIEEKSWQEIQSAYADNPGGETLSETTLRQRYSRGRKYLRSLFHREQLLDETITLGG